MLTRRNFLRNTAGLLIAAPMVVKASSLMPLYVPKKPLRLFTGYVGTIEGFTFIDKGFKVDEVHIIAASGRRFNQEPPNLQFMSIGGYSDDRVFQELMGKDAMHSRLGRRSVG